MACSCGYKSEDTATTTIKEVGKKSEEVRIADAEDDMKVYPITDAECPKCGHKKAYYWTVQTRAGDEPETKFLKCQKCKSTWRDYS